MRESFFELIIMMIFLLSSIPFLFQFKYGNRALWGWTKLGFWKICLISFIGQVLIALLISVPFFVIANKDGVYYVFYSCLIGILFLVFILILILFQVMVNKSQDL